MHVAGYTGETLLNKSYLNTEENVQELRLAALLHDVGHGPFSHLFEEILENKSKRTHENLGKEIISRTEISDILERYGYKSNIVCQLSFGESKIKFLNEVIAGALSADIMDYLPRDGLFTGAEYGKIDYHRLISSFEVVSNAHLALNRSALYSFESMLISRYEMFKAVYFHKTVRSAEVMLLQAMRLADEHLNLTGGDIEDYLKLTDDSTLEKIDSLGGLNDIAVQLVNDYRNRKLLKCVYEKFIHKSNDFYRKIGRQSLNRLALQISDDATVQDSSVFVDKSGASSMPLTPTKDEIRTIMLIDKAEAYETPVSEIPLIDSITGVFDVLRVYTTSKNRENVRQSALKILGVEHFSASRKQGIT
jgi:HD superfamily phosphohydrolase